jgi:RNA-directed DNA polymerase
MNGREKSDSAEVAVKPANKTGMPAAEQVERRAGTEGNAIPQSTSRTQGRADASQARDRIRVAARRNKKEKFTALLHHVTPEALRDAFYAISQSAAVRKSTRPAHGQNRRPDPVYPQWRTPVSR